MTTVTDLRHRRRRRRRRTPAPRGRRRRRPPRRARRARPRRARAGRGIPRARRGPRRRPRAALRHLDRLRRARHHLHRPRAPRCSCRRASSARTPPAPAPRSSARSCARCSCCACRRSPPAHTGVRPVVVETYAGDAQRRHHPDRARVRLARLLGRPRPALARRARRDGRGTTCATPPATSVDAADALAAASIAPLVLREKEGLALINGTDGMLGMLLLALHDLSMLLDTADVAAAMSIESPARHRCRLRRRPAWRCARRSGRRHRPRTCARSSRTRRSSRRTATPPCARACRTRTRCAARRRCTAPRATPSTTPARSRSASSSSAVDNPVITDDGRVESNGNFHGAPVAYVLDFLAIAVADVASISERRTDRALDPARSHGLPPFLAHEVGVDSGLMIAQYAAAGIVSELKRLAVPASVDSIPSSRDAGGPRVDGLGGRPQAPPRHRRARPRARDRGAHRRPRDRPARAAAARRRDRRGARPRAHRRRRPRPRPLPLARHRGGDRARALRRAVARRRTKEQSHDHGRDASTGSTTTATARTVRAARGNERTAKSWGAEAAKRMLMNNLDPEVAEHPEDLVVYGGTGKAARSWEAYDAIVRTLDELEPDETLLVQSGKPVGVFRTHEWAPRVLIANSNLVGDWATWPEFRRLEQLGLTMYGQMTAGSWIYIGTQGILQGTYETFAAVARVARPRRPHRHADPDRRMRRHGRRAAARRDPQRRRGAHRRRRRVAPRAPRRARLPRRVHDRPRRRRSRASSRRRTRARRSRVGVVGNAAEVFRELLLRGIADRHRHRPDERPRPARLPAGRRRVRGLEGRGRARPRGLHRPRARQHGQAGRGDGRIPGCRSRGLRLRQLDPRARRSSAASSGRSSSPASCRRTSGRSSPRAAGRSAGWRCRATRRTSARPTRPSRRSSPTTPGSSAGSTRPATTVHFEGLPARICWLGYQERHLAGLKFNEMVASGELAGPIVIGRDHLDAGSVASPVPRDRGHGRRLRRDRRLAAAERAAQHRERRIVGVDPPRRRRRHRPQHPCRAGDRRRRHARSPPRSSSACSRTTPAPGSCATSTPATTARRRSRASAASRCRCCDAPTLGTNVAELARRHRRLDGDTGGRDMSGEDRRRGRTASCDASRSPTSAS